MEMMESATDTDNTDPDETIEETIVTNGVASLLPGRDTVFGEDIATFPDPNQILGGDLLIWRYNVVGDQIVAAEFEAPLSHQLVWQRYVQLTPKEYRPRLTRVSFEANPDGNRGASAIVNGNFYGATPGEAESWLYIREPMAEAYFDAHQNGHSPSDYLYTYVPIHEQAHVIHNDFGVSEFHGIPESELYLYGVPVRRDSLIATYYENFWFNGIYDYWRSIRSESNSNQMMLDQYPDLFVSNYAATNISEDFAESFERFVREDSIPGAGSDYPGAEKIIWFWRQPVYVTLRDHMRAVL